MKMVRLKLGDKAWCYCGETEWHGEDPLPTAKLTEGKVVHVFNLDWGDEFYVIEVDTHIDPVLFVRTPMTVSDTADKPIGLWRRISDQT